MLAPEWRKWGLEQLGEADNHISVDLFASPWAAAAPIFITKELDSFSFSWASLCEGENPLLWANPPFSKLGQVAQKISAEPCRIALCTPEWTEEAWWDKLLELPHKRIRLPPRRHLFYGAFRKEKLPQLAWRTVVWLIDTRGVYHTPEPNSGSNLKGLVELKSALAQLQPVLWTHGFLGGKPMALPSPHTLWSDTREANTQTTPPGGCGRSIAPGMCST